VNTSSAPGGDAASDALMPWFGKQEAKAKGCASVPAPAAPAAPPAAPAN
jgi:hypothetical protein